MREDEPLVLRLLRARPRPRRQGHQDQQAHRRQVLRHMQQRRLLIRRIRHLRGKRPGDLKEATKPRCFRFRRWFSREKQHETKRWFFVTRPKMKMIRVQSESMLLSREWCLQMTRKVFYYFIVKPQKKTISGAHHKFGKWGGKEWRKK